MKKLATFLFVAVLGFFFVEAQAQIKTPAPSPSAKVMQTVGLTDVTIEYSRPSKKGRAIFGADGLVPFGKEWRTGANAVTKITFSDDVKVNGTTIPKGTYGIITIPNAKTWAVEFHPHESNSWSSYKDKTPTATVTAEVTSMSMAVETFLILMDNLKTNSADLEFIWDNTVATLKLETAVDDRVMAAIDKVLAGPTPNDYYTAGSYYFDSGKDLNQALKWVQKATHVDEPRFWQVRKESQILAALKRYPEAVEAAKKSLELAQAAGNNDYIRMNEKAISKWMKM